MKWPALLALSERLDDPIIAAVNKVARGLVEDYSKGYALFRDPSARALQLVAPICDKA